MIKTLTRIVAALAAIAAAPVCAQTAAFATEARVSFADLDMGSAAGRTTLDNRIKGAARSLCGPTASPGLAELNENRRCIRGAIAGARGQLDQVLASRGSGTAIAVRR